MTQQFHFWVYARKLKVYGSHRNLQSNIHSIIHSGQKWKYQQMKVCIKIYKMYIHTMEHYLAMKMSEVWIHGTTW